MEPTDTTPTPEVLPAESTAIALRDPGVSVTMDSLAVVSKATALEVIDARGVIIETARKLSIRLTSPEDWVLFKAPDDRITGYLQDAGCDRVRDVFGVEVFDVSTPQRIATGDGSQFMYIITGSGRSRLSGQHVETMEGGRSSSDEFTRGKQGAELELLVRKAARANLDGNITRELTGLKSIPIDALAAAWEGTKKSVDHCHKGRGFGTGAERLGATRETDPDVEPPTCPVCPPVNGARVKLRYRPAKGDRKAFFGCPHFEKHADRRVIIDAAEWIAKQAKPAAEPAPAAAREPGAEG